MLWSVQSMNGFGCENNILNFPLSIVKPAHRLARTKWFFIIVVIFLFITIISLFCHYNWFIPCTSPTNQPQQVFLFLSLLFLLLLFLFFFCYSYYYYSLKANNNNNKKRTQKKITYMYITTYIMCVYYIERCIHQNNNMNNNKIKKVLRSTVQCKRSLLLFYYCFYLIFFHPKRLEGGSEWERHNER